MSSPPPELDSDSRAQLIAAVTRAIYEGSTTAVFFHTAVAAQVGLGATEEKTLLLLSGIGSLTAGDIARYTGLTTPSVTSLIDRLESKGFVRRVRDAKDRRRVIVEPDMTRLDELARVFTSVQGTFDDLLAPYNDEQLATIADYLTRAALRSRQAIEALQHNISQKDSPIAE